MVCCTIVRYDDKQYIATVNLVVLVKTTTDLYLNKAFLIYSACFYIRREKLWKYHMKTESSNSEVTQGRH